MTGATWSGAGPGDRPRCGRGRPRRGPEAIAAGDAALAELRFRRNGLAASLVLIALVIAGLVLKIREINESRREG